MNMVDRVKAVREAGMVERCHTIPHLLSYTNARHTYGVACLIIMLWPEDDYLLRAVLFHDTPERWTGDVPGQVLHNNPDLKAALKTEDVRIMSRLRLPGEHMLSGIGYARFKAADRLEFWLWTWDEEAMGNRMVLTARATSEAMISGDPDTPPEVLKFMAAYKERGWSRHPEVLP